VQPEETVTYTIADPRAESEVLGVFYVGITASRRLKDRVIEHLNSRHTESSRRIEELLSLSLMPIFTRVAISRSLTAARESERRYIQFYLSMGCELTNRNFVIPHGEHRGNRGRKSTSDEIRLFVVERVLTGRWNPSLNADRRNYLEKRYIHRDAPKRRQLDEWLRERERNGGNGL
jgi:hypothetical protein